MKKLLVVLLFIVAVRAGEYEEIMAHRAMMKAEIMALVAKIRQAKNPKEKAYYEKIIHQYMRELKK